MDIRDLVSRASFSVPACGGGYVPDWYVREELRGSHPKQFLPGPFAPDLGKLTVSYDTVREKRYGQKVNAHKAEKYIFLTCDESADPWEVEITAENIIRRWAESLPSYRKVSNVKILEASLQFVARVTVQVDVA